MSTFGERLRLLRQEKGLRQKEIGELLGVQVSSIGKFENDQREPLPSAIIKLAEYFQVSADFLLGRSSSRLATDTNTVEYNEIADLPEEARKLIRDLIDYIRKKN
jgi:transcriptional regulator with XRE-family HTH domain